MENAKAEDLASVLSSLHGNVPYIQAAMAGPAAAPAPGMASLSQQGVATPQLTIPGAGFPPMGFATEPAMLSHVRIVPDPVNNQLVIPGDGPGV